jgi:hypothetical protein
LENGTDIPAESMQGWATPTFFAGTTAFFIGLMTKVCIVP